MSLYSQIGLNLSAGLSQFQEWNSSLDEAFGDKNNKVFNNNATIGLNYWFRLNKRRIEFLPQIEYSKFSSTNLNNISFQGQSFNAVFNVHVYIFDLAEDCDCPTFSKKGNLLKKGFYLFVGPQAKSFSMSANGVNEGSTKAIVPGLRLGAGLDFGITDMVTISPSIGFEKTAMVKWDDLHNVLSPLTIYQPISSNTSNLFASVRLGLRFDTKDRFGNRKRR